MMAAGRRVDSRRKRVSFEGMAQGRMGPGE